MSDPQAFPFEKPYNNAEMDAVLEHQTRNDRKTLFEKIVRFEKKLQRCKTILQSLQQRSGVSPCDQGSRPKS